MPKYIDAEKFAEHISGNLSWNGEQYNAASVISDLETFPTADVEPVRHGRWVGMQEYCQHLFDTTGERYTMSQLGISHPHCNQCWAENESRKPFCPNCGAKMFSEPPKEENNGNK